MTLQKPTVGILFIYSRVLPEHINMTSKSNKWIWMKKKRERYFQAFTALSLLANYYYYCKLYTLGRGSEIFQQDLQHRHKSYKPCVPPCFSPKSVVSTWPTCLLGGRWKVWEQKSHSQSSSLQLLPFGKKGCRDVFFGFNASIEILIGDGK